MTNTLTIIRGLPGSGKSTLAKTLSGADSKGVHIETDMYFTDGLGNYNYDRSKYRDAHAWCRRETEACLRKGHNVYVSNCFISKWIIQEYVKVAARHGATLQILECKMNFGSIHKVPKDAIKGMKKKWYTIPVDWKGAP